MLPVRHALGVGSLTNGLAIRYLGLSLGFALSLGLCSAVGTLLPPLISGELLAVFERTSGLVSLASVVVGLLGIAICGRAGMAKDRELRRDQDHGPAEYRFTLGVWLSILSGLMSACMAFAIAAGGPISRAALAAGTSELWQNVPMFVVILLGGFTSNCFWCLLLGLRNRTVSELIRSGGAPMLSNYALCSAAGIAWYLQFVFYGMGETRMGEYKFTCWSVFMAWIIIFSNLWGVVFREWRGTSRSTRLLIAFGLIVLVLSAFMGAGGGYLATLGK